MENLQIRAKEILKKMTLPEKIGQLTQVSFDGKNFDEIADSIREKNVGSVILLNSAFAGNVAQADVDSDDVTRLQRIALEETNSKIPLIFGRDVIHGHGVFFPINLAMAASFEPQAVRDAYELIRKAAAHDGINWTFAPMLDFCHDPRWGRIVEGQGEDPYLASQMAEAIVKGFQGDDLSSGMIAACAKHYIGYGASEGGRDYNHTEISDYALQNSYLPAFRAAVKAGVATVMNSFNEINGVPVAASKKLLTDILRGQLGFDGFVVSDWAAISQLEQHRVSDSKYESARLSIEAGIDMDMVDNCYLENLEKLICDGIISEQTVDTAVLRILKVKLKMGLFETPYCTYKAIDYEKYAKSAQTMAEKSMVMLKNNGALPLSKNARIALEGPFVKCVAEHRGTWALGEDSYPMIDLETAIKNAAPEATVMHSGDPFMQYKIPRNTDVIVCALGEPKRVTGEAQSLAEIKIPPYQVELVRKLKTAGKPLVGVLCFGRPIGLETVEPLFDAIIYAWHGGTMATRAIASVLFGDAEPSGRLPVTLPRATGQIPIYYNALPGARNMNGYYGEDDLAIFNYNDCSGTPLYPFGYGLSYTTFHFAEAQSECTEIGIEALRRGEKFIFHTVITNTGECSGSVTVQLYVSDLLACRVRPLRELKAFEKITLSSGESRKVTFAIGYEELGFYLENGDYIVEKGDFTIFIGENCLTKNSIAIKVF